MVKHIIVFGVALVLGVFLGLLLSNEGSLKTLKEINPIKQSCTHNGKTYSHGASVPSGDSCNSCGCDNGQVACTLMACEQ